VRNVQPGSRQMKGLLSFDEGSWEEDVVDCLGFFVSRDCLVWGECSRLTYFRPFGVPCFDEGATVHCCSSIP